MCDVNEYDGAREYDKEPVAYCRDCLSLAIRVTSFHDLSYCDECGSTDIGFCRIDEWAAKYKKAYGRDSLVDEEEKSDNFLTKKNIYHGRQE